MGCAARAGLCPSPQCSRSPSWSPGQLCRTGALVCRQRWLQPCHGRAVSCSPPQIHTFWVDAKNYVEHTRKWYAETIPFPLNFFLPNAMHKRHLERLQLMWGDDYMEDEEKLEKEVRDGVWAQWVLGGVWRIHVGPKSKLEVPPSCSPEHYGSTWQVTTLCPPPAALLGSSGMPDTPLPAPRLPEVFLWRLIGGQRGRREGA